MGAPPSSLDEGQSFFQLPKSLLWHSDAMVLGRSSTYGDQISAAARVSVLVELERDRVNLYPCYM